MKKASEFWNSRVNLSPFFKGIVFNIFYFLYILHLFSLFFLGLKIDSLKFDIFLKEGILSF